jgi:NAD(P)-dependent dehydrogenase (short-subunit alcohol dehydrogenase family)
MLNQKVAIITGGSSGIGRATAIALAKEGVKVVVAARHAKEGEETAVLIKEAGGDGIFVKTDVANEYDVRSLVEKTVKTYDRLDYVSSGGCVMGIPQKSIYAASKHAVLGLTKSAALEYAKSGIRINAIAPGSVDTDTFKQVAGDNKQYLDSLKSMHPVGRIGDPEEIANAVVWLLSDKASFVLGHTLLVDGGMVSR